MAKSAAVPAPGENRFGAVIGKIKAWPGQIKSFYNDVRTETRKVTAPSLKEVQSTTLVVIVTVALFGIFFWAVDGVLQKVVSAVLAYFRAH